MHSPTYPVIWSHPKNVLNISPGGTPACEDCNELYPATTGITSQCTDKCVVIACSDPTHNEANECHGGDIQCSLVCDAPTNCSDCPSPSFDEFLHCCTNYHSYFSEPRNGDQFSNTSISWNHSLEDILCSCNEAGDLMLAKTNFVSTSSIASESDLATDVPENTVMIPAPPLSIYTSYPELPKHHSPELESLSCMWGNCHDTFSSLAELVGHVNLEHLQRPSGSTHGQNKMAQISPHLACRWRDCESYTSSESIPTSSTGEPALEVYNFLTNHLLHDHLGMHSFFQNSASTADNISEHSVDSGTSVLSASVLPIPSTHTCLWQFCCLSFNTYEDLTTHITVLHIGGGKAKYECFWEGCTRNGSRGFSSKQKICRHLQSHTGHRPFQCIVCQQYFSEAATLQQHMRRHTQEKPYICDYPGCGKTFAITGALTIHKRIHNGHKPFKCKFCDKAFAESSNLSKHLRTHTGARPYCCIELGCNKSFARPDQLTRHLGVHRKKSPDSADTSA